MGSEMCIRDRYYSEREPPEELILEQTLEPALLDFLSHQKRRKVKATVPRQGEKKMLLDLARKNLEAGFFGDREKLYALEQALHLKKSPQVIECFDISHLGGTFSVGSWSNSEAAGRTRASTAASGSGPYRE